MRKLTLVLCLWFGVAGSSFAETKPTDQVGVINIVLGNDGATEVSNKRYFKQWKDIKLNASTKQALNARVGKLDAESYHQKFRVGFLFIIDDRVTRALFYGDYGAVVMTDWPKGKECMLHFDSNGGFAGIHNKACGDED